MADVHGSPSGETQMPAAPNSGPAPVPYSGADLRPEPPGYDVLPSVFATPGGGVMDSVSGNALQESGYAHDLNAGLVTAYYPGAMSPIYVGGDNDAGGRDTAAGTVAQSVANAEARYLEHESETHPQGSAIGDVMTLPPSPLDPGVGATGVTLPEGHFYDPPRNY